MKLIVIYGPPAVGKLTVAKALAKLTGYKVFHNHLTVDFLDPIIGYGRRGFFRALGRIRLIVFEAAVEANLPGMIFTFVYAKPDDNAFVKQVTQVVRKNGGDVCFVRLTCSKRALFRRVTSPTRRHFDKIRTPAALQKNLAEANLVSGVPGVQSLRIDTTRMSPDAAAKRIVAHYHLGNSRT